MEMVAAIYRLLDWAEGKTNYRPLFSKRRAARAAITKLEALADAEDARPEQPEENVAYVRACDQPEAMGKPKTVGVKWDQTGLVTVLVDGNAQFIFNPAIAKIGYMEGPIQ